MHACLLRVVLLPLRSSAGMKPWASAQGIGAAHAHRPERTVEGSCALSGRVCAVASTLLGLKTPMPFQGRETATAEECSV